MGRLVLALLLTGLLVTLSSCRSDSNTAPTTEAAKPGGSSSPQSTSPRSHVPLLYMNVIQNLSMPISLSFSRERAPDNEIHYRASGTYAGYAMFGIVYPRDLYLYFQKPAGNFDYYFSKRPMSWDGIDGIFIISPLQSPKSGLVAPKAPFTKAQVLHGKAGRVVQAWVYDPMSKEFSGFVKKLGGGAVVGDIRTVYKSGFAYHLSDKDLGDAFSMLSQGSVIIAVSYTFASDDQVSILAPQQTDRANP